MQGQRASASRTQGMTVLELLTVLTIVALLAAVATPSMAALLARNRADAAVDQMMTAVRFTRHLAISRGATATLCAGLGTNCAGKDAWHEGATVFLDADKDGRLDPGETVVQRFPAIEGSYGVAYSRSSLRVSPSGLTSTPGTITICPPSGSAANGTHLKVNNQARVEVDRKTKVSC